MFPDSYSINLLFAIKHSFIFILNINECITEILMANTSLTLGKHWELFIKEEVNSGRYASASEVVRDALRTLEAKKNYQQTVREHLIEAEKSGFSELDRDSLLKEIKQTLRRNDKL